MLLITYLFLVGLLIDPEGTASAVLYGEPHFCPPEKDEPVLEAHLEGVDPLDVSPAQLG